MKNFAIPEKYAHFEFGGETSIGGRGNCSARAKKQKPLRRERNAREKYVKFDENRQGRALAET